MLFGELEISSKVYYLIKIIIILLIILIIYKYFFSSELENFNMEGSENIDSLFNTNNLVVGDLVVTQSFNMIPKGSVVAWTKDKVPKGWAICDGTNGTPDLRGRFIVGSGQGTGLTNRNVGDNGGEENHVLETNEIPSHGHAMSIYSGFNVMRKISLDGPDCAWVLLDGSLPYAKTTNPIDDKQNEIKTQPHNNMPPFFILYYIMKL
jgi:microcystin-dependent protein